MEKTSKDLLKIEHTHPSSCSSFKETTLLVCGKNNKQEKPTLPPHGHPLTSSLPTSLVLGKVKDFLGVISEANKSLELKAKERPEDCDIEALNGNESEYIEMDLMLGVADLHTPEAVAAAEAAIVGKQPVFDLYTNDSSSESESSSDNDADEDDSDEDKHMKTSSPTKQKESGMQGDSPMGKHSESSTNKKGKRPKIIELS